jgi:hypothetical protein
VFWPFIPSFVALTADRFATFAVIPFDYPYVSRQQSPSFFLYLSILELKLLQIYYEAQILELSCSVHRPE